MADMDIPIWILILCLIQGYTRQGYLRLYHWHHPCRFYTATFDRITE